MTPQEIEELEIRLLLDALRLRYGYDFRNYARASLKRRVMHCLQVCKTLHISDLVPRLIHDPTVLERILYVMSVTVTEMFRDPPFFQALRDQVLPRLGTYPFINIWVAGCATGEEVYSLAVILKEQGLYDRARIYATDLNDVALHKAAEGIYPVARMQAYTANYNQFGGLGAFSDYYRARYGLAQMDEGLKRNIVWARHNLVTDSVFTDVQLVLCRNVLIYFDKELQSRVLSLFRDALVRGGYLCLGSKESLRFSKVEAHFQVVNAERRIYRKQGGDRSAL